MSYTGSIFPMIHNQPDPFSRSQVFEIHPSVQPLPHCSCLLHLMSLKFGCSGEWIVTCLGAYERLLHLTALHLLHVSSQLHSISPAPSLLRRQQAKRPLLFSFALGMHLHPREGGSLLPSSRRKCVRHAKPRQPTTTTTAQRAPGDDYGETRE